MEVISQKTLKEGVVGQVVQGVALIKGYTVKPTKSGKKYIDGQLQSGSIISFKAWGESMAFSQFSEYNYEGTPAFITGEFNEFSGTKYINVQSVQAVEGFSPMQFFEHKYPTDSYEQALRALAQSTLSAKGFTVLSKILFENTDLYSRFKEEFAAMTYHDNCVSGLLAHTYKVCSILTWVLNTYPQLCIRDDSGTPSMDTRDLLVIGTILHDIGKVQEMQFGVYQPNSAVTHCILGLDVLYQFKAVIEEAYGEYGFRMLQSILVEHHGEFGDKCRTVLAYIVNMVDVLDAKMTGIVQTIDSQIFSDTTGFKIRFDGEILGL